MSKKWEDEDAEEVAKTLEEKGFPPVPDRDANLKSIEVADDLADQFDLEDVELVDDAEHPTLAGTPDVLTVDELAELLRVNRKTVYNAINEGSLPARRIGSRKIRVLKSALIEWMSDTDKGEQ